MYIWAVDRVSGCNFPAARGERRGESKVRSHTHTTAHSGFPIPGSPPPSPHHTVISLSYNYQLLHQYFFVWIISNISNIGNHIQVPWNRVNLNPDQRGSEPDSDPRGSGFQFTLFHGYGYGTDMTNKKIRTRFWSWYGTDMTNKKIRTRFGSGF